MVKFFSTTHTYDYPLPAVSLAYFLRYPNPYSTHVLSTDTISSHFDPDTQRLHTTRLHLKQSKLPGAVLRFLPKTILGSNGRGPNGEAQNFVLETSVVDAREGWMRTESQNLQYTRVLSVVERQYYARPDGAPSPSAAAGGLIEAAKNECTNVETTVTFMSRFGQGKGKGMGKKMLERWRGSSSHTPDDEEDEEGQEKGERKGLFSSWSTTAVQRTIEASGLQRTRKAMEKSKEGMKVVLERLRSGGLVGVLEGMRRDREQFMGGSGEHWKQVWRQGEDRDKPDVRVHGVDSD